MVEKRIESVEDLLALLVGMAQELRAEDLWFRGQDDSSWHLDTKLDRDFDRKRESEIVLAFELQAPSRHVGCPALADNPGWWSLMQHHGVATRLLDWSHSPLVGAYFAVRRPHSDHEAAVWVLAPGRLNAAMDKGPWLLPLGNEEHVGKHFRSVNNKGFPSPKEVLAVLPQEIHLRLMLQQSRFTIHGVATQLDTWPGCDDFLARFVIPADKRMQLRNDLGTLGIQESSLFPDLDALSVDLNSRFRRRTSDGARQ